jgi:hypothetical protein
MIIFTYSQTPENLSESPNVPADIQLAISDLQNCKRVLVPLFY